MATQEQAKEKPDFAKDGIDTTGLKDGSMTPGCVGDEDVLLVKQDGELFAIGAYCTHYGGPLADGLLVGKTVRCPWHHACFHLKNGEALRAPALNPVACWRVDVRDGRAYVTGRTEPDPLQPQGNTVAPSPAAGPRSVVIIGAGGAGAAAAEMLRRQAYTGIITMIDEDPGAPCDRPSLSKSYLSGEMSAEDCVPLRPGDFYEKHAISLVRAKVASVDTSMKIVHTQQAGDFPFDALLLATGAEPRRLDIPGHDLPHVHTLRSFADSRAISEKAETAKSVVVLGSSFIGLEVAASLRARNVRVHVVSPDVMPLAARLGDDIGRMVKSLHEEHGVLFHLEQTATRIEGDAVTLKNGTRIPADLVVVGIGVEPRLDLARSMGLKLEKGVVVDEYLETSIPSVYAAGDIARWPDALTGENIRVEHWVLAQRHGQAAACNILGAREPFKSAPFFWSKHYDYSIRYIGHAEKWDSTDITGDVGSRQFSVAFRKGGKTLAVASVKQDVKNLEAGVALEERNETELHRLVPA